MKLRDQVNDYAHRNGQLSIQLTEAQKEINRLKYKEEDRHTVAVGQILQSMATMMESAARVVLSLHRNL